MPFRPLCRCLEEAAADVGRDQEGATSDFTICVPVSPTVSPNRLLDRITDRVSDTVPDRVTDKQIC